MSEDPLLARLAELAGIEPRYRDETGRMKTTSAESKRGVLRAMGFATESAAAMETAVRDIEFTAWREVVPPVVLTRHGESLSVTVTLPAPRTDGAVAWRLVQENGHTSEGSVPAGELVLTAASAPDGGRFERRSLTLPVLPDPGYHRLRVETAGACHDVAVIVSGERCFLPRRLARGPGDWGWALQLYALRSPADWGIGDFTRLREFVAVAAGQGAAAIGLNPLHALSSSHPERASPYSPTSRLLFTVVYIDVVAVPELARCRPAQERVASEAFQAELMRLRAQPLVRYRDVMTAKFEILELLFGTFRAADESDPRRVEFRRYQETSGSALRLWATFEAMSRHFAPEAKWWREWPKAYRDPSSPEVAAFVRDNLASVEFFEYLQWLAETQLAEASRACRAHDLDIGLYSDLALGVDHDSADVWGQGDLYAADASIGAPPDVMNVRGQNWGIAPMNPLVLRRRGYRPFESVLRASMRYGGALRIDHVMSLQRLYWIPEGAEPIHGAYVRQPFEDLLSVLALESVRARCMVIGEDLGTVPPGFRKRMQRAGVLSYKPLFFQTDKAGAFTPAEKYPRLSAAVVGTHDMSTLPGYWVGRDLEVRRSLGLQDTRVAGGDEFAFRKREKQQLIAALVRAGLWDEGQPADELSDALVGAIHAFLARSPARLLMARPEDALGILEQHNLPGTVDEHPNWRLRLPVTVQEFAAEPRLAELAKLLGAHRSPRRGAK